VGADFGSVRAFYAYPSLQYFTWEESPGGRRLLQEKGVLYSAGAAAAIDLLQTNAGVLTLRSGSFSPSRTRTSSASAWPGVAGK
ncbi:MAG TPA: hypothetical protein VH593_09715, partial [Ktedonobacteraceae bacterium]